jgi:hypothetical protein
LRKAQADSAIETIMKAASLINQRCLPREFQQREGHRPVPSNAIDPDRLGDILERPLALSTAETNCTGVAA